MTYHIYCITNKINNKSYIGQSINAYERWKDHIQDALRTTGKTANNKKFAIHHALLKYGLNVFEWQVIDTVNTLNSANEAEDFYIAYLRTMAPNGYNLISGGKSKKLSQQTKEKIRKKLKIVGSLVGKFGPDHPNYGSTLSEERKQQLSDKFSGDGGAGRKINSSKAVEIYREYLNNPNATAKSLSLKYGLAKNTVCNILNKKSWKKALKNLPVVDLKERVCGERWINSKLTEQDVINIIDKYKTGKYTYQQLADEYSVVNSNISNIINAKRWKHIKGK